MNKTGQKLREGREKMQLTISEVSLSTKINPRVLQAMEAGEIDKLPATSFLRGFIRSYAAHLKLDGDEILALFNEEINGQGGNPRNLSVSDSIHLGGGKGTETAKQGNIKGENDGKGNDDKGDKGDKSSGFWYRDVPILKDSSITAKSLTAAGIILLIVLIIGVKGLVKKYEREGSITEAPENLVGLEHDSDSSVSPEDQLKAGKAGTQLERQEPTKGEPGKNSNDEAIRSKESQPTVKAPVPPPSPSAVSSGAEAVAPLSEVPSVKSKPTHGEQKPLEPKPAEVEAETTGTGGDQGPQEVILEALDRVEISFRIDAGPLKKIILQPEQIHTIKGAHSIAIDLADGGAVNIIHNGIDEGVPGDLGKSKKVKYP